MTSDSPNRYLAGDWDSPDLAALIELAARNEAALTEALRGFAVVRAWHRVRHLLRPNSRSGSRRNIAAHYDLGNDFYGAVAGPHDDLFVGRLRRAGDRRLEAAQRAKYAAMAEAST